MGPDGLLAGAALLLVYVVIFRLGVRSSARRARDLERERCYKILATALAESPLRVGPTVNLAAPDLEVSGDVTARAWLRSALVAISVGDSPETFRAAADESIRALAETLAARGRRR